VLRRDGASLATHWAQGDRALVALYATAVAAELVDVAAQITNSLVLGLSSGLIALPAAAAAAALPGHLAGVSAWVVVSMPALPAVLAVADKTSLGCAAVSCVAGLLAEALKARREQQGQPLRQQERQQQQQQQQ